MVSGKDFEKEGGRSKEFVLIGYCLESSQIGISNNLMGQLISEDY